MIFRHWTLDPAGLNVNLTSQSQCAHVKLHICLEYYLNVTLCTHVSVAFFKVLRKRQHPQNNWFFLAFQSTF